MDPADYEGARVETVSEWDSIAQITLLTVIGEEFGFNIDYEEFEGATSFESLATYLDQKTRPHDQ